MKQNDNIKKLIDILVTDDILFSINDNLETLIKLIPEVKFMFNFKHNHPHHHLDVFKHTLYALSLSENDFDIRLTLLLHDIGKPFSYQDEEVRHFKNHAKVSANMTYNILKRLGFPNDYILKIYYLVLTHDTPITTTDINNNYNLQLKRYKIQKCDAYAHNPSFLEKRIEYINKMKKLFIK